MKPFLQGRPVQTNTPLRPVSGSSPAALARAATAGRSPGNPGPTVECVKQGDKVVRLIVTCACGEKIEVECLYPAGG
jgi:hypothetical protein